MLIKKGLRERSQFLVRVLHFFDCLIVIITLWFSTLISNVKWSEPYLLLCIISFLLSYIIFYNSKLYRPWRSIKLCYELIAILKAWLLFISITLLLLFICNRLTIYSREVIINWFVACPFIIGIIHAFARLILRFFRKRGFNLRRAVIVGATDFGIKLSKYIEQLAWAGIKVVGFIDDRKDIDSINKPILCPVDQLHRYLSEHSIDFVYIALPYEQISNVVDILNKCRTLGPVFFFVPDFYAFELYKGEIQALGSLIVINFNPDYRLKRCFDIVFSFIVLLTTLPILIVIAILIKLEDNGPVIYGHRRITIGGKPFKCWKFRTMCIDADKKLSEILRKDINAQEEWKRTFKLKNDPRITKVGRFLRRTSLDELPQFFNVLIGQMSVVGARPIVADELSQYYKENGGLYVAVKPGITGPWQISKRNDIDNYDERIELDTWYIRNHSFWFDIKVIFKTVSCIFVGKGAY